MVYSGLPGCTAGLSGTWCTADCLVESGTGLREETGLKRLGTVVVVVGCGGEGSRLILVSGRLLIVKIY